MLHDQGGWGVQTPPKKDEIDFELLLTYSGKIFNCIVLCQAQSLMKYVHNSNENVSN